MKKRLLSLLLAVVMVLGMLPVSAHAADSNEQTEQDYELRVLTFEDADYKGGANMAGEKNWSSLIDKTQYGGSLLYPTNGVVYNWYDEGNTELKHRFTDEWGDHQYWGGGEAISNYNSGDIETYGGYESQLTVYKSGVTGLATTGGGHNGSNNFAVHYGYVDTSDYGGTKLQCLTFGDGVARVIDHMYVTNICYALNCYTNGNSLTATIGDDDWVKLVATGHHEDGTTATAEIYLCNGPKNIVTDWTRWDLSGLGKITKLELNVMGSSDNGYGFSQPAYFAYDDVAVRFEKEPCLSVHADAPATASVSAGGLYQLNLSSIFADSDGHALTYSFTSDVTNEHTKISDGVFYFTATEEGTYPVTLKAQCAGKETATHTLNITVTAASQGIDAQYGYDETPAASVTVYVTLSNDGMPIVGSDGTVLSHLKVTVPYFDLSLYGLEDYYRYGTENGQGVYTGSTVIERPTGLHLYIYLLERYYLGLPEEECCLGQSDIQNITEDLDIKYMDGKLAYSTGEHRGLTITGSATSLYMANFWGHDENLMYFRNHCYPYMSPGWGATSDYILLSDGDTWDVAMFTNWQFHSSGGFFAKFDQDAYTAKAGETITVSTQCWGTTSSAVDFVSKTGLDVALYDSQWKLVKTLSYTGDTNSLTFTVPETDGTYYLMALDPNATDGELAKGAPATAELTVGSSGGSVDISSYYEKFDFIHVKDDQGRYLVDITASKVATNYNGDIPAHQIVAEEGTETVYVTFPSEKSFVVYTGKYSVEDAAESGYGSKVTLTTNDDGSVTVAIPVAKYLDTGAGVLLENNRYQMAYGFDFVTGTITKVEVGTNVAVSRILLNTYEKTLTYNSDDDKTFQLKATVLPAEATGWTVVWSSSNEQVATVDQTGLVTAVGPGKAVITATIGDVTASCTISTKRYNTAPVVSPDAATYTKVKTGTVVTLPDVSALFTDEQGDKLTYTAWLCTPESVTMGYDYSYSQGEALTVDETGAVSVTMADVGVYALKVVASDGELESAYYYQITVVPNDSGIITINDGIKLDIYNVAVVGSSEELVKDFQIPYKGTHDTIVHHIVLSKTTIDGTPYRKMNIQIEDGYGWCEYDTHTPGQKNTWQTRADIGLFAADESGTLTAHYLQFHTECQTHTDENGDRICDVCTLDLTCETCTDENGDRICDVCGKNLNQVPTLIEGVTDTTATVQTSKGYQLKDLEDGKIFRDADGDKLTYASYFYRKSSDGGETWGELTGFTAALFGGNDMTFVNDQEGTYIYKFWAYDGYGYSEDTWTLTLNVKDVVPANVNFYLGYDQNYVKADFEAGTYRYPVLELYRTAGIDENFNDYVGYYYVGDQIHYVYDPADFTIIDGDEDFVEIDGTRYPLYGYEKIAFTNSAFDDNAADATASNTIVGTYNMFYATVTTGRYSTRFYGYNAETGAYDHYLGGQSMELPMELDIYGGGGNDLYFRVVSVYTTSKKTDGTYFTAQDYTAQVTMPVTGSNIHPGDSYIKGNYTYYPFMMWANGNGSLYNTYVYPKDTTQYIFNQTINNTTVAGASVVTKNVAINTAVKLTVTVPANGEFSLFFQYNNFNTKAVEPQGEAVVNGDGSQTLTYLVSKSNSNYTWRLTDPTGTYVTKAGWLASIKADTAKSFTFSDATNKTSHDFSQLGTTVATRDEADIQVFLDHDGFASLSGTTRVRAFRMWQLINSDTANIMLEPDFRVQVLQGNASDVSAVNGGNAQSNWLDVTPTTTDIIAVNYDAIDVYSDSDVHGTHGGLFPATAPERTGVFVVTNETEGTATAQISFNGSKETSRGDQWDYNYDTWYYLSTDTAPTLDFAVTGSGETTVSYATVITDSSLNSTLSDWTEVTKDGSGYHADLLAFRKAGTLGGTVIIRMTDSTGTSYSLVRVAEMTVTITNVDYPGEMPIPGSQVKLTFDGLYRAVNKVAGIFNPTTYYLRYTNGETEVNGQLGQYQQMDRASITLTIPEDVKLDSNGKATYTFTNGYIYGSMYSATSPFDTLYHMTDTGVGTNFSAVSVNFVLSRLADVTVEVGTMSHFDVTVDITEGDAPLSGCTFTLTDPDGKTVNPDDSGIYRNLAWGVYSYALEKSGYIRQTGTLTVGDGYSEKKDENGLVHWAFAMTRGSENCWDGTTSEPAQNDGVYQISNGAELAWFANHVNTGNASAKAVLTADIDLACYAWTPIGSSSAKFSGSFDGQGHKIINLAIHYSATTTAIPYLGLFGYVKGSETAHAVISSLSVEGQVTMTSSGNVASANSAAVIGYAKYADISDVHNAASVTVNRVNGNWQYIGGVVGYADSCTITSCENAGSLYGYNYAAGIVGCAVSSKVTDCSNTGKIQANQYAAGIAGYANTSSTVTRCSNTAPISTYGSSYAAGIVAWNNNSSVVSLCWNSGEITSVSGNAAGIVANNRSTITACYNLADITAATYAGGIAASSTNATITNCYNTGKVTAGGNYVGAIAGQGTTNTSSLIDRNYYLTGTWSVGLGYTGYTPANSKEPVAITQNQLTTAELVANLNAELDEPAYKLGNTHPILTWQPRETPVVSIRGDQTELKPGDTVYVTVSLDHPVDDLLLAEFFLHYDTSLFTRGEAVLGSAISGVEVSGKNVALDGTELKLDGTDSAVQKFSINAVTGEQGQFCTPGTIVTIPFTAVQWVKAETAAEFVLELSLAQDSDYTDLDIAVSQPAQVTVSYVPCENHVDENPADHICDICGATASECVDENKDHKCDICGETMGEHKAADGSHDCAYCGKPVTECADNDKDHNCDVCGKELTQCADDDHDGKCDICGKVLSYVTRLSGKNRYITAIKVADELKEVLGVEKFDTIIVAAGENFADALSGSYLSTMKNAPILLCYNGNGNYPELDAQNIAYIKANLAKNGTVYILGGTAAVNDSYESELANYKVERLRGKNRFGTNQAILEAAGIPAGSEILVCTAYKYADSLSASATGKPILLVHNQDGTLYGVDEEFLSTLENCTFTIIGGTGAVGSEFEEILEQYGEVNRLSGKTRYQTSILVAETYFDEPTTVVMAYAWNYPDGLCGGTLAHAKNAPLILTQSGSEDAAVAYTTANNIHSGYVLGGAKFISDDSARTILGLSADFEVVAK